VERVDITIPHDDPAGAPHDDPGSEPSGPSGGPPGGPHNPSNPAGNPLSTSDDPNKVLPYSDYQTRGVDASDKLDQAIANKSPDKGSNSHDGYDEAESTETLQGISNVLTEPGVGLNTDTVFRRMKLTSKNTPDPTKPKHATYDADYNIAGGSIVVHGMDKGDDTWPKGNPERVRTSDLMAQVYRGFGGNIRDLRVVIQDSVLNPGTIEILETIYKDMGDAQNLVIGDFKRPAAGATDSQAQAFNALLGSDNVRPTVYMLTDHHGEAGDKRVQQIFTFPPDLGDGHTWNIAIILG
jgi:hypothetical protein